MIPRMILLMHKLYGISKGASEAGGDGVYFFTYDCLSVLSGWKMPYVVIWNGTPYHACYSISKVITHINSTSIL